MSDRENKGILCTFPSSDDDCSILSVSKMDDSVINYFPYNTTCVDIVNVYRRDVTFCKMISGFIAKQMLFLPYYNEDINGLQQEIEDMKPAFANIKKAVISLKDQNEKEFNNLLSAYSKGLDDLFNFKWSQDNEMTTGSMIHGNVLQDFVTALNIHRATPNAKNKSSIASYTDELAIVLPEYNTYNLGVSNRSYKNDKNAVRKMMNGCKSIAMMFKTMKEQVCDNAIIGYNMNIIVFSIMNLFYFRNQNCITPKEHALFITQVNITIIL